MVCIYMYMRCDLVFPSFLQNFSCIFIFSCWPLSLRLLFTATDGVCMIFFFHQDVFSCSNRSCTSSSHLHWKSLYGKKRRLRFWCTGFIKYFCFNPYPNEYNIHESSHNRCWHSPDIHSNTTTMKCRSSVDVWGMSTNEAGNRESFYACYGESIALWTWVYLAD